MVYDRYPNVFVLFQGKPTEAAIEAKVLAYGEQDTKDYLPGAEEIPDAEPEETKKTDGKMKENMIKSS